MSDTRKKLLDTAERKIRAGGYHAVSFRELASELGIKSSSVHYYFRRKQDLVVAVVERYSAGFFATLAEQQKSSPPLKAFADTYRAAFAGTKLICLCGMLGAEFGGLPEPVGKVVAGFLGANITWLEKHLPASDAGLAPRSQARQIVAGLQGAMLLAKTLNDLSVFDDIANSLVTTHTPPANTS